MFLKVSFPFFLLVAALFSIAWARPEGGQLHVINRGFPVLLCPVVCPPIGNDPVCGTDGLNYHSRAELHCHNSCGYVVYVAYQGRCRQY